MCALHQPKGELRVAPGSSSPSVLNVGVRSTGVPLPSDFTVIVGNLWPDPLFSSVVPPLCPATFPPCSCDGQCLPLQAPSCAVPACERARVFQFCSSRDHNGRACGNMLGHGSSELFVKAVADGSLGLFSAVPILPGELIVEFCGQVVSNPDVAASHLGGTRFFAKLTEETAIDGSQFGTLASFAKYSCRPNCHLVRCWVPDDVRGLNVPRVFIAAGRSAIAAGTALTVRYNFVRSSPDSRIHCFCNLGNECELSLGTARPSDGPSEVPAIALLQPDPPSFGRLGALAGDLGDAPENLCALRPYAYLTMTECVKLNNLRANNAFSVLGDILKYHKKLSELRLEKEDTWGQLDSFVKTRNPHTRFKATMSLFNVPFTAFGRSLKAATHSAAAKALAGLLSFAPAQSNLDLRQPPAPSYAAKDPLALSRPALKQQLDIIWTVYCSRLEAVSTEVSRRATSDDDPKEILERARMEQDNLARSLLDSFFQLVPSHVAACSALGFVSCCPLFVLKGPASVALYKRQKAAELRNQWRMRSLQMSQFARFELDGCHSHVVRIGEVKSHPNVEMLASEFRVSDFVDKEAWERSKMGAFSWKNLYEMCGLAPFNMQGNIISTARISEVLYPPKSVWEFRQFCFWVETQLGSSFRNGQWVVDESAPAPAKGALPTLVAGAVNEDLPSYQVAAQQAQFTSIELSEMLSRAAADAATMVAQAGSVYLQMNKDDASQLAEFCWGWKELVDCHLDKSIYRRFINNGIEYFLMPATSQRDVAVAAARSKVREGAVRFALGLPWNASTEVPAEFAGLSVLAIHKGTFLHRLEVYLHMVAFEYGRRTGRNFHRMKTCAFSLLLFQPGACKQQWHWDVMDTETLAINILVSKCSCGHCRFKGTEVLQSPHRGWLPPLPASCSKYCSTIKFVLQHHLPLDGLLQRLPDGVRADVEACVSPVAEFHGPSDLNSAGVPMFHDGHVGATAITCGPHRGPGNDNACERMVLFITMTRAVAQPYDGDDQVNAIDVIASKFGRHSREFLWTVIDMELVHGIRAVSTSRGLTSVTRRQCPRPRLPVAAEWIDDKLSLQCLLEAIVTVANQVAALGCARVPPKKGTEGRKGVHVEGIADTAARDAAYGIHQFLSCPGNAEKDVFENLCILFAGTHVPKDRQGAIYSGLQAIKKAWQLDLAGEAHRQSIRWKVIEQKLDKIEEQSRNPPARRKRSRAPGLSRSHRRRSGPAAEVEGPLDSTGGDSSPGVESPEDRPSAPSRPSKRVGSEQMADPQPRAGSGIEAGMGSDRAAGS
jgi:hypothetical protein